ncbi:Heat shock cognate 70 kDa protein [Taenia solium]|eukprot:TsM_001183100 transcript=TsM_001183100 gene=TsM_001183100
MLTIVDKVLRDAKLDKADVHEVLLVGGSMRVLKVQNLLQGFFSGSLFSKSINPDEAAAYGAALLASDMNDEQSLDILEVVPQSLNLVSSGGVITTALIERNMKIPTKKTVVCTTSLINQRVMLLRVYEGEHELTSDNNLAVEFHLLDVPPSPPGSPQIEAAFTIDESGILKASAAIRSLRKQNEVYVEEAGRPSRKKIGRTANEFEKLEQRNEKQRSRMATRNELENYILIIQSEIGNEETMRKMPEKSCKKILTACGKTLKRIEFDKTATKRDYKLMRKKVESMYNSIRAANEHGS